MSPVGFFIHDGRRSILTATPLSLPLIHSIPPFPEISGYEKAPKKERKGRLTRSKLEIMLLRSDVWCLDFEILEIGLVNFVLINWLHPLTNNKLAESTHKNNHQSCHQPLPAFWCHITDTEPPLFHINMVDHILSIVSRGKANTELEPDPFLLPSFPSVCFCNRIKAFWLTDDETTAQEGSFPLPRQDGTNTHWGSLAMMLIKSRKLS